jgi:serine protease AprX
MRFYSEDKERSHVRLNKKIDSVVKSFILKESKDKDNDDTLSTIITLKKDSQAKHVSNLCSLSRVDRPNHHLHHIKQMTGRFCRKTIQELSKHPQVTGVHHNYEVHSNLNVATQAVGGLAVRNQFGLTGKGVTIAIIDTGIYPHPNLINPSNRIIGFKDFINGRTSPYDDNGHGTHVAGDAASNGYTSSGLYSGPATEANLVGVKVLNAEGSGTLSNVLAGIDWTIQNKSTFSIAIMNLSLGAQPTTNYKNDPLAQASEDAWLAGIFVTAAAGNTGPNGTIQTPGYDPLIMTVGAINDRNTVDRSDDTRASYTSRKPTVNGLIKPDVLVPGTRLTSLISPNSTLAKRYPGNKVGNQYFILTGTSMATGLLSGMAAQVLQAYPTLTPDVLKVRLIETSQFFANGVEGYSLLTKLFNLTRSL